MKPPELDRAELIVWGLERGIVPSVLLAEPARLLMGALAIVSPELLED